MQGDIKNKLQLPLRVKVTDDILVTSELIEYCIDKNKVNIARCKLLNNYYNNETAIQYRKSDDPDKPNNKISHAFARYITKIATAYFMGNGVRYETKLRKYKKELDEILNANMTKIKHFEEANKMSKCGISFELLFINAEGKLKTQFYAADEMIPVFSQTPGNFLTMVLRPYEITGINASSPIVKYVDVYTRSYIYTWQKTGGKSWELKEKFSHNFSDVPVIVRFNNTEAKSDFEDVIPQIDAYDKAQSDTANDLDYFTNAYLVFNGLDDIQGVDDEGNELSSDATAKLMNRNRMIFLPTGGEAGFITKNENDTTSENHKKRVYKDIFFLSQVPNLTDEEFAGNLSGVAIKYKLFGLEELSIEKETYFTSSELKKVRLITEYINALKNTSYDWKNVTLKFDRSAVANTYEIAQIMNLLRDLLSDETLVAMFPGITDVTAELQRKLTQQQQSENSFLPPVTDGEVF
ncbi:MAG: phage portal protein [Hydrogenoanaerobacterium sp.]